MPPENPYQALSARACRPRHGFTLLELVIVVVIIAVVVAIAVPRVGRATQRSSDASILASTRLFQSAIDQYVAEHAGQAPFHDASGAIDTDAARFAARLRSRTDIRGNISGGGAFGPYLRAIPVNTNTSSSTLVIADRAPGARTVAWVVSPTFVAVAPDDREGAVLVGTSFPSPWFTPTQVLSMDVDDFTPFSSLMPE
jgi:prepilin-type N-terminal cleavage/methylation domain-containing protein